MSSSRLLGPAEREALRCFAASIDLGRVRIHSPGSLAARIIGALSGGATVALGYHIFAQEELRLPTLAHELMHVSQFEQWGAFRYLARGAWNQIMLRTVLRRDVYRYRPEPGKTFEDYGMEQQGQIVQDCFDPRSPRRAEAMRLSRFTPR
jgi:hypothetical protein